MTICFVETEVFTRRVVAMGLEAELRELEEHLSRHPGAGALDPGTGGLRKIRMRDPRRSKGKRGGARVHYFYLAKHRLIVFVFVYSKDEGPTLTAGQKKRLRAVANAIRSEWDGRA